MNGVRFTDQVLLLRSLTKRTSDQATMEQTNSIPKAGAVWQRLATNGLGIGERSEILSH